MWVSARRTIDQRIAADVVRQREGAGLVDPHQRRMDDETPVHAERQRQLHRLDRVVAAIRIAGKIGLAHAGDEVLDAAPIGDRAGEGEKHEIAARHECRRQSRFRNLDCHFAGERRLRNLRQRIDAHHVIVAEPSAPLRRMRRKRGANARPHFELDGVALPIIEADRLDAGKAFKRPGQAHRRILAARKQHEGAIQLRHHSSPLEPPYPLSQRPIRSTASRMSSRVPA